MKPIEAMLTRVMRRSLVLSVRWRSSCVATPNNNLTTSRTGLTMDPDLDCAKPYKEMPGITGVVQILRTLISFLPLGKNSTVRGSFSLPEIHMRLHNYFGTICRVPVPGTKHGYVFLFDPDDIKKVYMHEGRYPYRDMFPATTVYRKSHPDKYPNLGLISENGKSWYDIRSKLQVPMMKPRIVETYIPKMAAVSEEFVEHIHKLRDDKKEVPDFLHELYKWSIESTGLVTFNARIGCLYAGHSDPDSEAQRIINATTDCLEAVLSLELRRPWQIFSSKKKLIEKIAKGQDYVLSVAEKYNNLTVQKLMEKNDDSVQDLGAMGEILKRKELDPREIPPAVLDMLSAGVESTAHTAAFILYLLGSNMAEQEKVYRELDEILPSADIPITPEILRKLHYLKAAVKEGLRLMATIDGTYRVLDHDVSLGGYHVPAGAILFLGTQVASILPQNFPDADKFLPGRWLSDFKPHPYANLPFSHGPRSCIGRRIALQILHLLFIKILQKYKIEYHHEKIRRITHLVNLPDRPLRVSLIERK